MTVPAAVTNAAVEPENLVIASAMRLKKDLEDDFLEKVMTAI